MAFKIESSLDHYVTTRNGTIIKSLPEFSLSTVCTSLDTTANDDVALNTTPIELMCESFLNYRSMKIKDVKIIVPNKVVQVEFANGSKQKAVCQDGDKFDLETAIAICLAKQKFGGAKQFYKAVRNGVKVYNDKQEEIKKQEELQKRIEKKRAKRKAHKEKIAQQKREEQIEIQKEAYIRAMEIMKRD